jgi:hypothetical protein
MDSLAPRFWTSLLPAVIFLASAGCASEVTVAHQTSGGTGDAPACTPGAKEACYSGPSGTQGVGTCVGGNRTCLPDGSAFGPCQGESTPQAEVCSATTDSNCDGSLGCTGNALWSKSFGETVYPAGIAADSAGNVLVTGAFMGAVDFGDGPHTSTDDFDAFVLKLDPAGNLLWSKTFGGVGSAGGAGIGVDADDDILLTGYLTGKDLDFGGGPLELRGGSDVFAVKLDPAGHHVWSKRVGGAHTDMAVGLAIDDSGGMAILGEYADGPTDLGGGTISSGGDVGVFVVRFDAAGNLLLGAAATGPGMNLGVGIAVSPTNDVFITGSLDKAVTFGDQTLTSAGSEDVFVAQLDPLGYWGWARRFGGGAADVGYAVQINPAGNLVLTGLYTSAIDFGDSAPPTSGYQPFLVELSPGGDFVASSEYGGGAGDAYGSALGVAPAGDAILAGVLSGAVTLEAGPLVGAGSEDIFVARYGADHQPLWSHRFGDEASQLVRGVAVDRSSATLLTGTFAGTLDFGVGPLKGSANPTMFIAKLAP